RLRRWARRSLDARSETAVRDLDLDLVTGSDRRGGADDLIVRASDRVARLQRCARRERTKTSGCVLEARPFALDRQRGCAAKPVVRVHEPFATTIEQRTGAAGKT